jgi:hypothetical protein
VDKSKYSSGVQSYNILICSEIALRKIGLSHSEQRTTPMSARSGWAPNIFMSRAESHDVGGEGRPVTSGAFGDPARGGLSASHENGEGEWLVRLSLIVIAAQRLTPYSRERTFGHVTGAWGPAIMYPGGPKKRKIVVPLDSMHVLQVNSTTNRSPAIVLQLATSSIERSTGLLSFLVLSYPRKPIVTVPTCTDIW